MQDYWRWIFCGRKELLLIGILTFFNFQDVLHACEVWMLIHFDWNYIIVPRPNKQIHDKLWFIQLLQMTAEVFLLSQAAAHRMALWPVPDTTGYFAC